MRLRYHPSVQRDVIEVLDYYHAISPELADAFWSELTTVLERIRENPASHHFDVTGLRRANLHRFPYHVLFRIDGDRIRITVVRHHHRRPSYGGRRK